MEPHHPITPPHELVQQWKRTAPHPINEREHYHYVTLCAAQWGADQELEACYEYVVRDWTDIQSADMLLAARRPKPPTLKEQAIKDLDDLEGNLKDFGMGFVPITNLRKALEALPND
jgi:hypothetical protein